MHPSKWALWIGGSADCSPGWKTKAMESWSTDCEGGHRTGGSRRGSNGGRACNVPSSRSSRGSAPAIPDLKEKPSPRQCRERAHSRFLRSQPRRIGLGSARQARPRRDEINVSWVVLTATQNRNFLLCWKEIGRAHV